MSNASQLPRSKSAESKIKPVVKTTISDEIVDQIMSLIAKGDLKPGQRLPPEAELSKIFGTGRSSLREALRCLCIVGVLNSRIGEGTSVAVDGGKFLGRIVEWRVMTERHDIEDLMEIRVALEGITAANAALRRSSKDLLRLETLLARMDTAVNDGKLFVVLDLEFHIAIAEASKKHLIVDLVAMIRGQLAKTLSRVLLLPDAPLLSLKEHISVVDAIRRRAPEAARKAMQSHLGAALERYHRTLEREPVMITTNGYRKVTARRA